MAGVAKHRKNFELPGVAFNSKMERDVTVCRELSDVTR
jgi:hypothetical protein